MHKSSAWPLALLYGALIVYASLYPFSGWRDQGIAPWAFLASPWPKYWTAFDLVANLVGYGPLGVLLALGAVRRGGVTARHAVVVATGLAATLSLAMEMTQSYLPVRVASNLDLGLNVSGAWLGAVTAWVLERLGAIDRWSQFRARWFVEDARGGLVLLALWPLALLFPASVPFGLGQVMERLEEALGEWLHNTPFLELLPLRELERQPMGPALELVCAVLGALIPCLLGYCIIRNLGRRMVFMGLALAVGVGATALSAALSWGPSHAWAWMSMSVHMGLVVAGVLALLMVALPRRACAAVLLLALAVHLSVLNQASPSPYFAQTLQIWEQGRFIRFHGLAQWLGWLWPYAALVFVLVRLSRRESKTRMSE